MFKFDIIGAESFVRCTSHISRFQLRIQTIGRKNKNTYFLFIVLFFEVLVNATSTSLVNAVFIHFPRMDN